MLLQRVDKDKNSNLDFNNFLRHENEPPGIVGYKPSPEDEVELMANRFFLKRRVWRNMDKIRRADQRLEPRYRVPKRRVHRVRHQHLAA